MTRQTSIDVYHQIESEGLLSRSRFMVYDVIFKNAPITMDKVEDILHGKLKMRSISGRFSELERLGVIYDTKQRSTTKSGYVCVVWDITNNLPSQLEPKVSNKEKIRLMSLEIEGLKRENEGLKRLLNQKQVGQGFLGF